MILNPLPLGFWKGSVKRGTVSDKRPLLHKFGTTIIEAIEDRRVKFTISTSSVDRERDTIAIAGWDLEAYAKNPVVLWGHCSHHLPIGKCLNIGPDGESLKAEVEFVPADMPEVGGLAEAVLRMCRTGFLSATSVGFRPLEYEIANDRDDDDSWWPPMNFLRQELMEFSIVSIPANPEALIDPAEVRQVTQTSALSADELVVAAMAAVKQEDPRTP
jgi:HK97 family phage prohead protease